MWLLCQDSRTSGWLFFGWLLPLALTSYHWLSSVKLQSQDVSKISTWITFQWDTSLKKNAWMDSTKFNTWFWSFFPFDCQEPPTPRRLIWFNQLTRECWKHCGELEESLEVFWPFGSNLNDPVHESVGCLTCWISSQWNSSTKTLQQSVVAEPAFPYSLKLLAKDEFS